MPGENRTRYERSTARRPKFNPAAKSGKSQGGIKKTNVETLSETLVASLKRTCTKSELGVTNISTRVAKGRIAVVEVVTGDKVTSWAARECLQEAVREVWESYSREARQNLGYMVNLDGALLTRCW